MECGKVTMLDSQTGSFAVETDGGLTVCELLDGSRIECGDIITGDLEYLGVQELRNETKKLEFVAAVEYLHCPLNVARKSVAA